MPPLLYHNTQVIFAYNTNHIEGRKLTEDQTRYIFETDTILFEVQTVASVDDILETANHFKLEKIHPIQDGNGRVGRIIAFKECLKNNIVPFIILDKDKLFYYRGLKEYKNEKGFLIKIMLKYFKNQKIYAILIM